MKKGRSCKACHEPHAGDQEKHVRPDVPFGSGGVEAADPVHQTGDGGQLRGGLPPGNDLRPGKRGPVLKVNRNAFFQKGGDHG
jgi:hypothetical protein